MSLRCRWGETLFFRRPAWIIQIASELINMDWASFKSFHRSKLSVRGSWSRSLACKGVCSNVSAGFIEISGSSLFTSFSAIFWAFFSADCCFFFFRKLEEWSSPPVVSFALSEGSSDLVAMPTSSNDFATATISPMISSPLVIVLVFPSISPVTLHWAIETLAF